MLLTEHRRRSTSQEQMSVELVKEPKQSQEPQHLPVEVAEAQASKLSDKDPSQFNSSAVIVMALATSLETHA